MRNNFWTQDEIKYLIKNFKKIKSPKIAKNLNRSRDSVYQKARGLGLRNDFSIKKGSVFGSLTIIKKVNNQLDRKNKVAHILPYYLCLCECGKKIKTLAKDLKQGKVKTCGFCVWRKKPQGEVSWSNLYKRYQVDAKRRKRGFELSFEDFKKISSLNCAYCNDLPKEFYVSHARYGPKINKEAYLKHVTIFKNGIDRVDSTSGYSLKNCVPCCTTCNRMKTNHSKEMFFKHMQKILDFQKTKGEK